MESENWRLYLDWREGVDWQPCPGEDWQQHVSAKERCYYVEITTIKK